MDEIVDPLGPALLKIPDTRAEVAFLESFTSQMFARRGGYGSNLGWSADVWLALQHAHVRCDVIFEETLLRDGLDGRRFLVLTEGDVLTEPVVKAIKAWQAAGGKLIADEFLCPALKPIWSSRVSSGRKRPTGQGRVLALAAELGPKLGPSGSAAKSTATSPRSSSAPAALEKRPICSPSTIAANSEPTSAAMDWSWKTESRPPEP